MKSIYDSSFRYVNSNATDLRKTFARVRREQREREAAERARAPQATVIRLRADLKRAP